jgi:REP element-mobilizing transposase RayT
MDIIFNHRKVLDHRPPPGIESPEWFLTICTRPQGINQLCHPETGSKLLDLIRDYHHRQCWNVELVVLMPDHLHAILSVPGGRSLSTVVASWKRLATKRFGISWQRGFFDHRLRSASSAQQKWKYVMQNPVRAGLASDPVDWPYVLRSTIPMVG